MAASLLFLTLVGLLLVGTNGQQKVLPVNRLFTVDAGVPTPDLKCVVGFHSIEEEVTWRMNCSEAHTKEMVLSKDLRKALKWVPGRRILKFGSQSNGEPWLENVTSWVCATIPMAGTVTYDCIPEVAALSPCLHLDVLCPPQIHSVSTLWLSLSVSLRFLSFPIWVSKYGDILVAGRLNEAWSETV